MRFLGGFVLANRRSHVSRETFLISTKEWSCEVNEKVALRCLKALS